MADNAKASRSDLVKAAMRSARAAVDAAREAWAGSDRSPGTSTASPGTSTASPGTAPSGIGAAAAARAEPPAAPGIQRPASPRPAETRPDEASTRRITEAEVVLRRRVEALKAADYKGGAVADLAGSDDEAHQMKVQDAVTQYVQALRHAAGGSVAGETSASEDTTMRLVRDALNGLYLAGVWDGRTTEPGQRSGA